MICPKIELHVHFEGTIRPATLFRLAQRNGAPLAAGSADELEDLYRFRDFDHFIDVWLSIARSLRPPDFREIVVEYAEEAARHGVVYLEGIFSPAQFVRLGARWEEVFESYCDGAQEARERLGVEVRLTPDVTRSFPVDVAEATARHAVSYRDRGVVGLGLGGYEAQYPPGPFESVFRLARDGGVGSVPHAGEAAGAESVRVAVERLGADRIRHGVRAIEDPGLLRDLADRGIVLDICPTSNVCTGIVTTLDEHPLPTLLEHRVACSISSDDPAMFGTDVTREHEVAWALGLHPRAAYEAGVAAALCDEETRARLRAVGDRFDWASLEEPAELFGS